MRRWLPSDMVGLTGVEYFDSTQGLATGAPENGTTPVNTWTAIRPGGGTPTAARSFRDDFRPYISTVNGKQSVLFDAATRQLNLDTANLPAGRNDKFWFLATKNMETRSGDYYPLGYGGGSGSAVTWKMRRGQVPYSDIGTFGFNVGSAPIAASGISIITEAYRQSSTLTRSWYNGQAEPSTYVRERNTSASNARLGHWPTYGNGSHQHLLRLGWGYGEPTVDDILRLQGWMSWDTGDDGASLPEGHPYKAAAPMFDDGAAAGINASASITLGALTGIGAAVLGVAAVAAVTLGAIGVTGAGQSEIAGSAAVVLDRLGVSGTGAAPVTAIGAAALGPVTVQAAGSTPIGATASVDLGGVGIEAAAAVPTGAAAQISLGSIDVAASGRLPVGGTTVVALDGIGVSGTATTTAIVTREASGSITLDAIGIETAASVPTRAAAQISPGSIDVAAFGRLPIGGMMVVALDGIGVSATGTAPAIVTRDASASIALGDIGAAAIGRCEPHAGLAVALAPVGFAARAAVPIGAQAACAFGSIAIRSVASLLSEGHAFVQFGPIGIAGQMAFEGPLTAFPVLPQHRFTIPARPRAFTVPARPRAFVIRKGISMSTISKHPTEERKYQADWTADLAGQAIVGTIVAISNDAALVVDRVEHDGQVMTFWLSGGRAGTMARLQFTAATSGGEDLTWQQTVVCN